ncbi:MAG: hypothetical protein U0V56_07580 [Actinomycetota bacterium]
MFGHVDQPEHRVAFTSAGRPIQADTGGFNGVVLLLLAHQNARIYLAGGRDLVCRSRTTSGCTRLARTFLDGSIPNVQVSGQARASRRVRTRS